LTWRARIVGFALALVFVVGGYSGEVRALDVPPAPTLDTSIVDQTRTLTEQQIADLSDQIRTGRTQKDYQIGILIIPTLGNDEYLEGYSLKVARQWGIGTKEKNNGVLMLVVKDDRKIRIEVGRGLEGDLTDIEAGRIIRDVITPNFKKGDYYNGIRLGTQSIQAEVEGRPDPNALVGTTEKNGFFESIFFLVIFGMIWIAPWMMWLISILARSKSWWAGGVLGILAGGFIAWVAGGALFSLGVWAALAVGGLLLDFFVSRNYKQHLKKGGNPAWWAGGTWGWGDGSSSGDSWGGGSSGGSFGGGSFGGGGSSGSW